MLYSWGELGPGSFFLRLGGLWLAVFTVLGAPIAAASFNPSRVSVKLNVYVYNYWDIINNKKSLCIHNSTCELDTANSHKHNIYDIAHRICLC